MEQEQPFLITDLVPPERHNAYEELADELRVMVGCSPGCIPVKTWTTGKTLTVQMQVVYEVNLKTITTENGFFCYDRVQLRKVTPIVLSILLSKVC